jgi:uncharacterized RDD family membrane protein YckC
MENAMKCNHCGTKVSGGSAFCVSCRRPLVGYAVGQVSTPAVVGVTNARSAAVSGSEFAGFWLRFAAALIDGIILSLALGVVASLLAIAHLQPVAFTKLGGGADHDAVMKIYGQAGLVQLLVFFVVSSWLYFAFSESSSAQGTPGKLLIGLYVADSEGNRPSFLRASGRFSTGRLLAHIPGIGAIYFLVDCICAGVTPRKQAVHDMITGCLVLKRARLDA